MSETDEALVATLTEELVQHLELLADGVAARVAGLSPDEIPNEQARELHSLYVMGVEHMKGAFARRLRGLLLQRKFIEAGAALEASQPR